MARRVSGWTAPDAAGAAAERRLGPVLYASACAALLGARDENALDRDAARLATVAPLLQRIYRLSREVMEATYADPVPLGDHPDAPLWRHVTDLGAAAHAAVEALRSRGPGSRRARASRDGERRAFVGRFVALAGSRLDGHAVAAGLAYFAIEAGLDDPPRARGERSAAEIFRAERVHAWRRLLRETRTDRKRGARSRRNR